MSLSFVSSIYFGLVRGGIGSEGDEEDAATHDNCLAYACRADAGRHAGLRSYITQDAGVGCVVRAT